MQTSDAPGLRERKREETRERMEKAAVEIALAEGVENATVDVISAAANVSSRTFFNYFDSKEDAILGVRDAETAARAIEAHAAESTGADVVEWVIMLLSSVLGSSLTDSGIQRSRITLVRRHPQLLTRQMVQITRMSEQLTTAIEALLAVDPTFAGQSPADRAATAEVLLALCGGAFRVVVKEWMIAGDRVSTKELETRAIALVADLKERLS